LSFKKEHLLTLETLLDSEYNVRLHHVFALVDQYHGYLIYILNRDLPYGFVDDIEFTFLHEEYFKELLELLEIKVVNFENPDHEWDQVLSRMYQLTAYGFFLHTIYVFLVFTI
jgi:hypothetical protein